MRRIRFLHVVKDDKFFHPIMEAFSKCNEIESKSVLFKRRKVLSYIKEKDNVEIYSEERAFVERIIKSDYDVLYLHSLPLYLYKFIKHIPKDKIVIWWTYGYDIYGQQILGLDSFINLNFYGKQTQRARLDVPTIVKLKRLYAKYIISPKLAKQREYIISRIDYFQPVCDIDYELMVEYAGLKAKKFYTPFWGNFYTGNEATRKMQFDGSVLIGNSAAYVQNHFDVWDAIKQYIDESREVVVPLSYGVRYYANQIIKIGDKDSHNMLFLDKFLPQEEYFKIFERCSYAVFGTIRQHAMGNVYNALLRGLKVFFYKESYVYKYLKKLGCVVFAIEDINMRSFVEPLSIEDQQLNIEALKKERADNRRIGEQAINELLGKFK